MLDCVCFVRCSTTKGLKCMVREFSRSRQCNDLANSLTFDLRASRGLWFADWHPQIFSMHQITFWHALLEYKWFQTFQPPSSYISSFQPWHQLAIMVSRINNIDAALLIEGPVLWEFDNAGLSVCILFFWFFLFLFAFVFSFDQWLRELACQLHGGLFNPTRQLQNANPSTKILRTAPLPRIYSAQKCMKSQHKGIERHITCCKTFNHVQAHQPYNCCYSMNCS